MATTPPVTLSPGRAEKLGPARGGRARARRRIQATPYLLIAPALIIIGGLLLWPVVQMARMSFQKVGLAQIRAVNPLPTEGVGTANYRTILTDPLFWHALRNTVYFAAVTVTATLVLGTLTGLLLGRLGRKMSAVVGTGLMLAWGTPAITAAIIYKWLFSDTGGLVDWLLSKVPRVITRPIFGPGDLTQHTWSVSTSAIYIVLILCVVWQSFPFIAVSVLAGLRTVPGEIYEAARADGAGAWRIFWKLTFPMLRPIFSVLAVLSLIWDFKVFTQLFILNGGLINRDGFNLSLYGYSQAFLPPINMGLGGAIAVVLTVILLLVTLVYLRQMVRQEELA